MAKENSEIDRYLGGLSGEIQVLSRKVRKIIFEEVPEAQEEFKWSRPIYSNGSIGSKGEAFCYFQAAKAHVSLGFHKGTEMDDPEVMLEGTGKQMRHMKLRPGDVLPEEQIRALLRQATTKS